MCGKSLSPDTSFCAHCGHNVNEAPPIEPTTTKPNSMKGKMAIYILVIAILTTVLVRLIMPGETFNRITGFLTENRNNSSLGNNAAEPTIILNDITSVIISAGGFHTVGLRTDGTVIAVGSDVHGQLAVSDWYDIVSVAAGGWHTVSLKSNGTVVAVGNNEYGQLDVLDWQGIVAISAYGTHTVGLKFNGTVVAIGENRYRQLEVSDWRDIIAVATGGIHTVGLKSDGTVITTSLNNEFVEISEWRDITAISAGDMHIAGLKSDGTVVVAGIATFAKEYTADWHGIVAIAADSNDVLGLRSDGTVISTAWINEDVSKWRDIIAISANSYSLSIGNATAIGVMSDGRVMSAGNNFSGELDVLLWNNIGVPTK
jgi:alpha-tubulin suppressor-like RCC1 family protein